MEVYVSKRFVAQDKKSLQWNFFIKIKHQHQVSASTPKSFFNNSIARLTHDTDRKHFSSIFEYSFLFDEHSNARRRIFEKIQEHLNNEHPNIWKSGWQWCWWLYDGDWLEMLVTNSWWQNHYVGAFFRYVGDFLNVLNRSPTSWIGHQHLKLVTNISVSNIRLKHPSPTSMSLNISEHLNIRTWANKRISENL